MDKDHYFLKMGNIMLDNGIFFFNLRENDLFHGHGIHHYNNGSIYIG